MCLYKTIAPADVQQFKCSSSDSVRRYLNRTSDNSPKCFPNCIIYYYKRFDIKCLSEIKIEKVLRRVSINFLHVKYRTQNRLPDHF